MQYTVPELSVAFITICLLCSVALPAALLLLLRKRFGADWVCFVAGCLVFLSFALVLEGACNSLIFHLSPLGELLQSNTLLYCLFGGLMAGLFEETGRFAAFSTALKSRRDRDANALMYGAGHGGIEMLALLGLTSVNNLAYSLALNGGAAETLLAAAPEETRSQLEAVFAELAETPSWFFLLSLWERFSALGLQIALSVLVWFAAKQPGRRRLYPLAIGLHLAADAVAAWLSRAGVPVPAIEAAVTAMSAAVALLAWQVWKRCRGDGAEHTA